MEYHLIFNPAAGRNQAARSLKRLQKLMQGLDANAVLHPTSSSHGAEQIAGGLKDRQAVVIAAGGDGTVHEVVNGMAGGRARLGIVPLGGGNDLARSLNIPGDIEEALAVIAANHQTKIDLGRLNGRLFVNQVGLGFDADVVRSTLRIPFLRGFPLYLAGLLGALRRYKNREMSLFFSGESPKKQRVFMVLVCNGEFAGGGFRLAPGARLDDGLLDVYVFEGLTPWEIARHLPKAIKGTHVRLSQVHHSQNDQLRIECPEGSPLQADGEMMSLESKIAEIEVLRQALTVLVPDRGEKSDV